MLFIFYILFIAWNKKERNTLFENVFHKDKSLQHKAVSGMLISLIISVVLGSSLQ